MSLRFPGQYHDRESGLFYNHNRDYDPKLGRYVQSDPIGLAGGVNRYGYVSGDPVNFVDPTGLVRDTGRCTGSRTCSGLARTFVYSGNITDCYVWDTYTNGTYTGTSPGGCNYTDISGQFSTIGDGTQYAQFGPIIDFPTLPLFEIAHSLAYEFDDKMCKIVQKVAEGSELGLTAFERLLSDALNQSDSELVRSTDGRAMIGYSFDVSVFAAYILGGHGSIGVWGDNGNYGYTVTAGPSAGIGGSLSLGASPSINYDDATHGVRVAAGAAVGLLGGEIGAGTQFSNIEANIGVGTPTAYASFQYVYVGTCND